MDKVINIKKKGRRLSVSVQEWITTSLSNKYIVNFWEEGDHKLDQTGDAKALPMHLCELFHQLCALGRTS